MADQSAAIQRELDSLRQQEQQIYRDQRTVNAELRQVKQELQNPNLTPAEKDALAERGRELEQQYTNYDFQASRLQEKIQQGEQELRAVPPSEPPPQQNNQADDDNPAATSPELAPGVSEEEAASTIPNSYTPPDSGARSDTPAPTEPVRPTQPQQATQPRPAPRAATAQTASTQAGRAGAAGPGYSSPGGRLYNPLGDFSSYTYQLSLYMLSAEGYNLLSTQGYQSLAQVASTPNSVYLIAQSGGINNSAPVPRAPFFQDVDFFIDDLKIKTLTPASTASSLNTFEYSWTIIEPMSFTFIDRLKNLALQVQRNSRLQAQQQTPVNPLQAQYLLAIRFYGYDKNGAVVTSKNYPGSDSAPSDNQAVFERFFPVFLKSLKFSLGAGPTRYAMTAVLYDTQRGAGSKNGMVQRPVSITAGTVEEALIGEGNNVTGLFEDMNAYEQELVKQKKRSIANEYRAVFEPDSQIPGSGFEQDDFKKTSSAAEPSTAAASTQAATLNNKTANPTRRTININNGVSVIQALDTILAQSNYVRDALRRKTAESTEGGTDTNTESKTLNWYVVNPAVEVLGWDELANDWAHRITYRILGYRVPYVKSVYVDKTLRYYGPHKLYEYYFTGKNREIIQYEQQYNTLYYINASNATESSTDQPPLTPNRYQTNPVVPAASVGENSTSARQNGGNEAENSIKISLYSPGDQARAKMTILGDPDFLDQSLGSLVQENIINSMTGRDYTVNANGGQVYVEIVFATASDYSNQTGLLVPQNNIKFWEYPPQVQAVTRGIVYMVITVTSEFSRGVFRQVLDMQIAQLGSNDSTTAATDNNNTEGRPAQQPTAQNGARAAENKPAVDLRWLETPVADAQDPESQAFVGTLPQQSSPRTRPAPQTQEQVADDDGYIAP